MPSFHIYFIERKLIGTKQDTLVSIMRTQRFNQQKTTMWQICRNDVVRFEHERNDRPKALALGASIA